MSKANLIWAVPLCILTYLVIQLVVFLPLFLIGLVVLAMPLETVWVPSRLNYGMWVEAYRSKWVNELWGNHEDGLLPSWWLEVGGTRYSWFLRNPVNNMRFWPLISTKPDPKRVRFIGVHAICIPGNFIAWQGWRVGLRWHGIWIGFAVNPNDVNGIPNDWRAYGFTVVSQWD